MAMEDFFGQIGSGLMNLFGVETTNQQNERLMREQWQREDTAMQRRVKDLEAAGLSKWLAAGTGGASTSAPVTLQTPDYNFIGDAFNHAVANDSTRAATKKVKEESAVITKTASAVAEKAVAEAREATANAIMAEHDQKVLSSRPYQMRGDDSLIKNVSAGANVAKDVVDKMQPIIDKAEEARKRKEAEKAAKEAEQERKRKEKEKAKQDAYWAKIHAAGDKAARDANVKWHWHRIWDNQ